MSLVSTLTPPLLGAVIGWTTNYVAIRMLFRPLKPWKIFGIRLPMTPGVIPSKRHDLAVNIGKMVGSQLLTSADISRALSEDAFKRELEGMIDSRIDDILRRDMGPLPTVIPKRFRTSFEAGVNILRWRAVKIIHSYLDSPEFSSGLGATLSAHLETFLNRPLESWLPAKNRDHLFEFINGTTQKLLASPQVEEWLRRYMDQHLASIAEEGKSLSDLLPNEFTAIIIGLVDKEIPGLLDKAAQYTGEPAMRAKMSKAVCNAISSFIVSMGPMASLVGNFLSPEIIESKVNDYLDEKGDDIALWLNNDQTRAKASAIAAEKISLFMSRPLPEILANLNPDTIETLKSGLCREISLILQSPQTCSNLTALLRQAVETQTNRPGKAILSDLFGTDGLNNSVKWTTLEIMAILRSNKSKRVLDDLFSALVNTYLLGQPLGALTKLLPKEVQAGITEYVVQQSHSLLLEEVPRLVDFVNIQRIVTRKVDSLDLLRLERLLLSIMEEQFKYINLFGGLLGFVIGLSNLLFLP